MSLDWVMQSLSAGHNKGGFFSNDEALDKYIKEQAGQDMRRGFVSVTVASKLDSHEVLGYYTLSASSVSLDEILDDLRRKMPRYGQVPAVLLGRLAVSITTQGQGLGGLLLADALKRAYHSELGWVLFIVKAKHEQAAAFYEHFGFTRFVHEPLLLWLTRQQAGKIL